jgi:hypothetical protein
LQKDTIQSDRESSSGDDGSEEIPVEVKEKEQKDPPAPSLATKPTGFVFGSAAKSTVSFAILGQTAKPLFGEGNSKEEESKKVEEQSAEAELACSDAVKSQGNTRTCNDYHQCRLQLLKPGKKTS